MNKDLKDLLDRMNGIDKDEICHYLLSDTCHVWYDMDDVIDPCDTDFTDQNREIQWKAIQENFKENLEPEMSYYFLEFSKQLVFNSN